MEDSLCKRSWKAARLKRSQHVEDVASFHKSSHVLKALNCFGSFITFENIKRVEGLDNRWCSSKGNETMYVEEKVLAEWSMQALVKIHKMVLDVCNVVESHSVLPLRVSNDVEDADVNWRTKIVVKPDDPDSAILFQVNTRGGSSCRHLFPTKCIDYRPMRTRQWSRPLKECKAPYPWFQGVWVGMLIWLLDGGGCVNSKQDTALIVTAECFGSCPSYKH